MEMKINSINKASNKNESIKKIKDINTSFSEVLNEVANSSNEPKTTNNETFSTTDSIKTGNKIIDNLSNKDKGSVMYQIEQLNKIFDIDIMNNKSVFFNQDSTINIRNIIGKYGNNVSANEIPRLNDAINTLYDKGLIRDEDYFYTLKWIATKEEAFRIQAQKERNEDSISNLMWKPKKNRLE